MNCGKLRHKITIQYNSNDGTTDPLPEDWKTFCTVWAEKKGLKERAFYQAAAAQSENDVVFTIRYRTGIVPEMRIVYDPGKPFRITAEPIDPDDRQEWLELHARRIDTNGS